MLKNPSIIDLASNFISATSQWVAKGLPVVSEDMYKSRMDICNKCINWDPNGNLGMGKCGHSKCGCTKYKQWLGTSTCPVGKWGKA